MPHQLGRNIARDCWVENKHVNYLGAPRILIEFIYKLRSYNSLIFQSAVTILSAEISNIYPAFDTCTNRVIMKSHSKNDAENQP